MTLRDEIARALCEEAFRGHTRIHPIFMDEAEEKQFLRYADRILALLRNPPDLGDLPLYKAGYYSRRNIEAYFDDVAPKKLNLGHSISTQGEE